jgi:hypothetical protein
MDISTGREKRTTLAFWHNLLFMFGAWGSVVVKALLN